MSNSGESQANEAAQIRELIENWARAVRDMDLAGVLAHHPENVVMFDVPPPLQSRGIAAYKATWEPFFAAQGQGVFDLHELEITAGVDVAFCHSLVTCGIPSDPAGQFQVRLTVGLHKVNGQWFITHEHHSVPAV